MKELICIVCPKGCHLKIDETDGYRVTGNGCEKGIAYGKEELLNPTRVVTSTVKLTSACLKRLPVKTSRPVPKNRVFDVMRQLDSVAIGAPVRRGDVLITNVLGLGSDIVADKTVED